MRNRAVRRARTREQRLSIAGWVALLLVFSYASGALAHLLPAVLPVTRLITDPLLLVLNGLVIWIVYRENRDVRLWYWLAGAYAFTFATEAIGVATGFVFGEYAYGPTMWWQWRGVPFVIALNWCVLTLAANELAGRIVRGPIVVAGLAGIILALYDVAIEPVAIALDYWSWAAVAVPVQNYLAWAVVGALISLPLQLLRIRFRHWLLLVYFFAQLGFFVVLWLRYG